MSPTVALTEHEFRVLECACRGQSAPETAETLGMPLSTVKGKRHRIIQKLGVGSIEEIVEDVRGLAHLQQRGHEGDPRLSPWARDLLAEFDAYVASGLRDQDAVDRMHQVFAGRQPPHH